MFVPKASMGANPVGTEKNFSKEWIITGTIIKQAPTPKKELISPTNEPASSRNAIRATNTIT